jgi:transcriptional regulator with PAS, ATPase and Fis domain
LKPAEYRTDVPTRLHDAWQRPLVDLCGGEIVVVEGMDRGLRIPIGPATVKVGSGAGSHLLLTDPTVSRHHCQLSPRPDGVRLVDSGSTNGTIVNGVRVRDADLLTGATVCVGATTLRIELGSEPVRISLSPHSRFGELLGGSIEMRRLYAVLELVAPTDSTVLIQGETGTGKELVAREVHAHSLRAHRPFVAVDCGAIAPHLIESELFGHVRGAFSGAVSDRRGLIEEAAGGTLFLDEIGELPLNLQAKLLRALEAREVRRVGANAARQVDVRLVAATNRPLAQSVNDGSFREDLYYRLAVVEVLLPPLRGRPEDIPTLVEHFSRRFSGKSDPVPADLLNLLVHRSWPGNVRELRNFVERSITLGMPATRPSLSGMMAKPGQPAATVAVDLNLSLKDARDDVMLRVERLYVESALRRSEGNVTRAAQLAGVSRRFLQRTIARLGVRGATTEGEGQDDLEPPDADLDESDSES